MSKQKVKATVDRLDRLHTIVPKGKPISGHCLLAAEAELGLIRYKPTEANPSGNSDEDIAELKARCEGAWWAKPYDKADDRVIYCSAPWHEDVPAPGPKEESPSKTQDKRVRARREAKAAAENGDGTATSTAPAEGQCKNGHVRTEENTYTDPRGSQVCRDCKREAAQRHKAKKEAGA